MDRLKNLTWQGIAAIAIVVVGAIAMAKLQMPDLAKGLVSIVIGTLALVTVPGKSEDGDA